MEDECIRDRVRQEGRESNRKQQQQKTPKKNRKNKKKKITEKNNKETKRAVRKKNVITWLMIDEHTDTSVMLFLDSSLTVDTNTLQKDHLVVHTSRHHGKCRTDMQ